MRKGPASVYHKWNICGQVYLKYNIDHLPSLDTSYVEKNNLKFGRKKYIRISLIEGCC
jgi:hypothetical protein